MREELDGLRSLITVGWDWDALAAGAAAGGSTSWPCASPSRSMLCAASP